MTTETKVLGSILLVSLLIVIGAGFLLSRGDNSANSKTQTVEINYALGQKIGSDSAKVKLVEFSDFQCPACQAAQPVVKQILSKYPQDVQLIYRHFPLPQHQHGKTAAIISEVAAANGKFWPLHDKLFETQEQWSSLTDPKDYFTKLISETGIDQEQLGDLFTNTEFVKKVEGDIAEGSRLQVSSTPTFFINGKLANLRSYNDLLIQVENELK